MGKYQPRVKFYHQQMIDWMIANPGGRLEELAAHVGRSRQMLTYIVNSDMFRAALAQRRAEFQAIHDLSIIDKTTKVAHATLDVILQTIEKKKDSIPLDTLLQINDSALSRLGYASAGAPSPVQVNVNQVNNPQQQVVVPVSRSDLEEARMAFRQMQESKRRQLPPIVDSQITEQPLGGATGSQPRASLPRVPDFVSSIDDLLEGVSSAEGNSKVEEGAEPVRSEPEEERRAPSPQST